MPWLLDTPIDVGDLSGDGNITHVRAHMKDNDPDRKRIFVKIVYGRKPATTFLPSTIHPEGKAATYAITGDDWDTITTTHTPEVDEKTYAAAKRGLYEELVGKGVIGAGSVV